jgi:hypothetical protein
VEEQRRFTLFWLECSVEAGQPLRPSRAAPLYQPLPYALPLPGMEHVEGPLFFGGGGRGKGVSVEGRRGALLTVVCGRTHSTLATLQLLCGW